MEQLITHFIAKIKEVMITLAGILIGMGITFLVLDTMIRTAKKSPKRIGDQITVELMIHDHQFHRIILFMKQEPIVYTTTDWETGETLEMPEVTTLLLKYKKKLKLDKLDDKIPRDQAEIVFAKMSQDFVDKKLTLPEYSALGHYFFHRFGKFKQHTPLFDASLAASELFFYSHKKGYNLSNFLRSIDVLVAKYHPSN